MQFLNKIIILEVKKMAKKTVKVPAYKRKSTVKAHMRKKPKK